MNIDMNALIASLMSTLLIWILFGKVLLDKIEKLFFKNKRFKKIKMAPIPDGKEFDRYFVSIMSNKGWLLTEKSGSFENKIKLDRFIKEEEGRKELEFLKSMRYSNKW